MKKKTIKAWLVLYEEDIIAAFPRLRQARQNIKDLGRPRVSRDKIKRCTITY